MAILDTPGLVPGVLSLAYPEADGHRQLATSIAGTGVGLHLVSMVVALHQGEVFVESLEGVGSRFVVRLPVPASTANVAVETSCDAA